MKATSPPPLLGLVLAGGRSERLARDKAAVRIDGVVLLDRAVNLLAGVTPDVCVAVRPDQVDDAVRRRHRLITDPQPGLGPAGGLLAAHLDRPDAAWLVLACDMPAIDAAHVGALVARRDPARAGVAWRNPLDGLPEPLCALYEPATLARLAGQVAAGRSVSPRALLAGADVLLLESEPSTAFSSINTPADLARFAGE